MPAPQQSVPLPLAGPSDAAARARDEFAFAASRRTPVLVVAEDGSRAGDVASALHEASRGAHPILAVDCSAHEPADLAALLFGAPEGEDGDLVVLGAASMLIAAAAGTLFIGNVEDLPASAQRRLVRVLRDGEVRVGSSHTPATLACRIVCSSSRPLEGEVKDGRFRPDLAKRFQECRIAIPPLRQRPADLGPIVERLTAERGGPARTFTQAALTVLAALPWPRNIDELSDMLSRILLSSGPVVRQEDVLGHLPIEGAFARHDLTASLRDARRRFEREYIAAVLERHQWRMPDAARTLGIERANLYRKTRQLGITRVPGADPS